MIVGFPPFYDETPLQVFNNIWNFKENLVYPMEEPEDAAGDPTPAMGEEAWDLVIKYGAPLASTDSFLRLLAEPKERLGQSGKREILTHKFFSGLQYTPESVRFSAFCGVYCKSRPA